MGKTFIESVFKEGGVVSITISTISTTVSSLSTIKKIALGFYITSCIGYAWHRTYNEVVRNSHEFRQKNKPYSVELEKKYLYENTYLCSNLISSVVWPISLSYEVLPNVYLHYNPYPK